MTWERILIDIGRKHELSKYKLLVSHYSWEVNEALHILCYYTSSLSLSLLFGRWDLVTTTNVAPLSTWAYCKVLICDYYAEVAWPDPCRTADNNAHFTGTTDWQLRKHKVDVGDSSSDSSSSPLDWKDDCGLEGLLWWLERPDAVDEEEDETEEEDKETDDEGDFLIRLSLGSMAWTRLDLEGFLELLFLGL